MLSANAGKVNSLWLLGDGEDADHAGGGSKGPIAYLGGGNGATTRSGVRESRARDRAIPRDRKDHINQ